MPPKVLPTREELGAVWINELKPRGFFTVRGLEYFRRTIHDERAVPPSPREGAELGFGFTNRDLTAIGWSSYVPAFRAAREEDCGWLVIEQRGEAMYFVQLNRTKYFVYNLTMELRIARKRILHRPVCKLCGKEMDIERGQELGQRFWRCPRCPYNSSIRRLVSARWDTKEFLGSLSPEEAKHLKRRRASRKRWQDALKKLGKEIRQAMLKRKKWVRVDVPPEKF